MTHGTCCCLPSSPFPRLKPELPMFRAVLCRIHGGDYHCMMMVCLGPLICSLEILGPSKILREGLWGCQVICHLKKQDVNVMDQLPWAWSLTSPTTPVSVLRSIVSFPVFISPKGDTSSMDDSSRWFVYSCTLCLILTPRHSCGHIVNFTVIL